MSDKLFNTASFEEELYRSMEKQLVANQKEEQTGFQRLAQAAEYLNNAAEIFEQAGMTEEAAEIAEVLRGVK